MALILLRFESFAATRDTKRDQGHPWGRFDALVEDYESDRDVRRLSTKSQLVALIHAQLSGAHSLREIEATLGSH